MAINSNAGAGNYLFRSASVPAFAGAITMAGWINRRADRNTPVSPFGFIELPGGGDYIFVQTQGDGETLTLISNDGVQVGPAVANDEWWYVLFIVDFGTGQGALYTAQAGDTAFAPPVTGACGFGGAVANAIAILDDAFSEWWDGACASVGVWTKALSQAEREAQLTTLSLAVADSCWAFWPLTDLTTAVDDVSGNARHLSIVGEVEDEAGPVLVSAPAFIPRPGVHVRQAVRRASLY